MTNMTVKEVIEELSKMPQDMECLLAIDQTCGFPDTDCIDVYPIESVFKWTEGKDATPISGYGYNKEEKEKVLIYVYP